MCSGGTKPLYILVVYKVGIQIEAIEYGLNNWVDFIPTEAGKYEIDIRVKDEFSSRKCDASTSLVIEAKSYVAADIDYILLNSKEIYLVDSLGECVDDILEESNTSPFLSFFLL